MNSLTTMFSSNCTKRFLLLKKQQVNEDEKWDEKAVEYLVKKLKNKQGALSSLEKALVEKNPSTPCVLLTKSVDGRMQVLHRKVFPHLAYCKIWRWPELRNHNELKNLTFFCNKGYRSKLNEVCINPYHYEKVDPKANSIQSDQLSSSNSSFSLQSSHDNSMNKSINFYSQTNSFNYSPLGSYCESPLQSPTSSMPYSPCSDISNYSNYSNTQSDLTNSLNSYTSSNFSFNNQAFNCSSYGNLNHNVNNWCSIVFYQFNYPVCKKKVIDSRFDINGQEGFSVNKDLTLTHQNLVKDIKDKIGQGIQLFYENGQVYLKNLSYHRVYIQNCFVNFLNQNNLLEVIELPSSDYIKIFDETIFQEMVLTNYNVGYEAVSNLIKFCKTSISFAYGWGPKFGLGDLATKPCWFEINMDSALKFLDKPLSELVSSKDLITSES